MKQPIQRNALVTGGSRGIGQAVVRRFEEGGIRVIAPTRRELDLASHESVRDYLRKNKKLEIDILVNNAAETKVHRIPDISLEEWQRILAVNLTSAFLLIQAIAPRMMKRKWGRIVNVSSCYSFLSREGRAAYSASKGGLDSLTRTAALEYGPRNTLVNSVCPGFVLTDLTRRNNTQAERADLAKQTALKRLAEPDEIADVIHFLCSERNTYITGQAVIIDGGFSCR
jgi:3-oxoacyl-[acyl-carrier protein] reductase